MIHPSRRGIYCDLCGLEILIENNQIEYYSIEIKKVINSKNSKSIEEGVEMDVCEKCHSILYERVHKVSIINDQKRKSYGKNNL